MSKIGDRIGAILGSENGKIKLLGYGEYTCDDIPHIAIGFGEILAKAKILNPRLELDNGTVVYGCECWWGCEQRIKDELKDKTVIDVNINDVRAKYKLDDEIAIKSSKE